MKRKDTKMEESDIIILDNDERYNLLKKVVYNDNTYFLAAQVKEDDSLDTSKTYYFKASSDEEGEYVDLITNEKLILEITKHMEIDTNN